MGAVPLSEREWQRRQERLQSLLHSLGLGEPQQSEHLAEGIIMAQSLQTLAAEYQLPDLEQTAARVRQWLASEPKPALGLTMSGRETCRTLLRDFRQVCDANQPQFEDAAEGNDIVERLVEAVRDEQPWEKPAGTSIAGVVAKRRARRKSDIPLAGLINAMLPWIRQASSDCGKQIALDLNLDNAICIPDHQASIYQTVLVHLLRNAIEHGIETPLCREMALKPMAGCIGITLSEGATGIRIQITDDGAGMPDPDRPTAPNAFWLEDSETSASGREDTLLRTSVFTVAQRQPGLGIGLHIVRAAAERLGGEFTLEGLPGQGVTATLLLGTIPLA